MEYGKKKHAMPYSQQHFITMFQQQATLIQTLVSKFSIISRSIQDINVRLRKIGALESNSFPPDRLLQLLYGQNNSSPYKIQLQEDSFPDTLYKNRYFSFNVKLYVMPGYKLEEKHMQQPLICRLFTKEFPPKQLIHNGQGDTIMKGFQNHIMIGGKCQFNRVMLRQITSHYKKGSLNLVIYTIDDQIQPLVLSNIVVKAKRIIKQV